MKVAELLNEIDHDDSVYYKKASDFIMNFKIDDTWEPLMTIDDHSVIWKQVAKEYRVIMLDKKTQEPMFRLELMVKTVKVPGGTLTGVITDSLSSKEAYRGKGHALKIYEALIQHGQVLFSSNSQTTGSRRLWEQLVQKYKKQAFVLAEGSAASWYIRKFSTEEIKTAGVLLTGPFSRMDDEAYASGETRWLVLPSDLDGLNRLQDGAFELT